MKNIFGIYISIIFILFPFSIWFKVSDSTKQIAGIHRKQKDSLKIDNAHHSLCQSEHSWK